MQAFKDKLCATLVDFLRKAPQRFLIHFDGLSFDLINLSMNRFVTCVPVDFHWIFHFGLT